jgi:hypothetical protein
MFRVKHFGTIRGCSGPFQMTNLPKIVGTGRRPTKKRWRGDSLVHRRRSARAGFRALDAEHVRSPRALARVLSTVRPERDPLIRDPAVNEDK